MSSKFSVRPAVRKRPWICKKSPAQMSTPPYPPQLIATVYLKNLPPTAPILDSTTTLALTPLTPNGPYTGFTSPPDPIFNLTFHWGQGQKTGYVHGGWSLPGGLDVGDWEVKPVKPLPYFKYVSYKVINTVNPWLTRLEITS